MPQLKFRTNRHNPALFLLLSLYGLTLLSGAILASSVTSADVIDDVAITVPVACNMTGELDTPHTATINPGQNQTDIGTTNFIVFCNDSSGYAIYAIGYSNEEYGNNKLLATINNQLTPAYDIITGTATSGNTSNWSMKLTPVTGTYAPTIESDTNGSFASYHVVPTEYTKVATFASNTDFTIGSSLQSTYQAFVTSTQPAGTYAGKVKYTLVHPNDAAAPLPAGKIGVNYNGNGKTFAGGADTNTVVYAVSPMYIATTPEIAKSDNVANDGAKNIAYADSAKIFVPVTATGASKMKVVVDYGVSTGTGLLVAPEVWDGEGFPRTYEMISDGNNDASGTATYVFDSNSITMYMENFTGSAPTTDYDYGFYARVYPIYTTEQSGTEASGEFASFTKDSGIYATTTDWYGSWYADINGEHYDFIEEAEIDSFIGDNLQTFNGTTIDLMRGLTFNEAYTRANKSVTSGYKMQDLNNPMCQTIAITQNQSMIDIRDNNTYLVGKLKDGRCWMLDNLALDPTDSITAANMNAGNTNASAAAITNLLNGGSTTTGWSSTPVANVTINFYANGHTVPRINNQSKNTLVTSYGPASSNGQAKVGIYYNFCAASASTYCYTEGQSVDVPNTIIDAPEDICPANWRMPTGGNGGEYVNLYQKYNTTMDGNNSASLQYNLSTPLSGNFNTYVGDQGQRGYWWSSTYNDGYDMHNLIVTSGYVSPYYSARNTGNTMRCLVAR